MEDFKTRFADYLLRTCIPSNAPKEESDSLWREMDCLVQPNIPQKLYRFRSCSLDNFISLEQETIPVCIAGMFLISMTRWYMSIRSIFFNSLMAFLIQELLIRCTEQKKMKNPYCQ